MDFNVYPYPSKRYVKYSMRGMCATSNHLAAQAGLDVLKKGGNAFDAAIAMATCLTVLEPQSNGIGGDAFAILTTKDGKMYGLNSTGCAPELISIEKVKAQGVSEMPKYGFTPVTVPGIPASGDGNAGSIRRAWGNRQNRSVLRRFRSRNRNAGKPDGIIV